LHGAEEPESISGMNQGNHNRMAKQDLGLPIVGVADHFFAFGEGLDRLPITPARSDRDCLGSHTSRLKNGVFN
jgi:hypothetical protein